LSIFLLFLCFGVRGLVAESFGISTFMKLYITESMIYIYFSRDTVVTLGEDVSRYNQWIIKPARKCIYEIYHSRVRVWSRDKSRTTPQIDSVHSDSHWKNLKVLGKMRQTHEFVLFRTFLSFTLFNWCSYLFWWQTQWHSQSPFCSSLELSLWQTIEGHLLISCEIF
jgi:hypothetical protein